MLTQIASVTSAKSWQRRIMAPPEAMTSTSLFDVASPRLLNSDLSIVELYVAARWSFLGDFVFSGLASISSRDASASASELLGTTKLAELADDQTRMARVGHDIASPAHLARDTLLLYGLTLSQNVADVMFGTIVRLNLPRVADDYGSFGNIEADVSSRCNQSVIAYGDRTSNHRIAPDPHTVADHRNTGTLAAVALSYHRPRG
jgi:hypothetical protein